MLYMYILLLLATAMAWAQPRVSNDINTQKITIRPSVGGTRNGLELLEDAANGTNKATIRGRANQASDCVFEFGADGLYPCSTLSQNLGDATTEWLGFYGSTGRFSSSGALAISVPNSTNIAAVSVPNGGVSANGILGTTIYALTGGYYVGSTFGGSTQVIDSSRNASFANLTVSGTCTGCGSPTWTSVASDILPSTTNTYVNGNSTKYWASSASGTETLYSSASGVTPVLNIPNATSVFAIYVPNGGIGAASIAGTTVSASTGGFYVGASPFQVIDASGNMRPVSNYGANIGTSGLRFDQYYGRTLNLQTNGSSLALIQGKNNGGTTTFSMGDGGGTGGEFLFYNSGSSEYFGAINGQLRFNGSNGLTTTITVGSCTITTKQGGITATSGTC